jgi:hypothetical protein
MREVVGSELSCYTTAVARMLEALGLRHEVVIGAQLYTAVRAGEPLEFVHQHTSLRAGAGLTRRGTDCCAEAVDSLREQVAAHGAAVVAGDAYHLPWQVTRGVRHSPHWFVIDAFAGSRCHVTDPFEYESDLGVQNAYRGWHPVADMVELAQAPDPDAGTDRWAAVRERHALGDVEDADLALAAPMRYQWYEAVAPRGGGPALLDVLRGTVRHHGGQTVRADLHERGWTCGLPALDVLREQAADRQSDESFYDAGADLWVAGRCRLLFARACDSVSSALGEWCRQELVSLWAMVPRVMEYNRSALRRGRPTRRILAQVLTEIIAVETELLDRVDGLLRSGAGEVA